jgi:hypothetical protein
MMAATGMRSLCNQSMDLFGKLGRRNWSAAIGKRPAARNSVLPRTGCDPLDEFPAMLLVCRCFRRRHFLTNVSVTWWNMDYGLWSSARFTTPWPPGPTKVRARRVRPWRMPGRIKVRSLVRQHDCMALLLSSTPFRPQTGGSRRPDPTSLPSPMPHKPTQWRVQCTRDLHFDPERHR